MLKRKQSNVNTLPLFEQLADADQIKGFQTADEKAFKKERVRHSKGKKHVPLAHAPLTGPACLRCRAWMPPRGGDEFGECRHLVKTLKEAPWAGVPAGTIVDRDTARNDLHVEYDQLRTGEAFNCSAYRFAMDVEDAA